MIEIRLENLELYRLLRRRHDDQVASVLQGLLVVIAGDAREFLEFVRNRFPSFTSHNLQHSWRLVSRAEAILEPRARAELSSLEIFSLIVAAAFHDVGMTSQDKPAAEVRRAHHQLSEEFLVGYMRDRLSVISEYTPRLLRCIGFIMKAHGLAWDDMAASELFKRPEKILNQQLRTNILAILLRLGDLLDLDSDRSCDALRRHAHKYFTDESSSVHHERHKHVIHFNYDNNEIALAVEAHSKEEHSIWTEWLSYIEQDILHANTFVFRDTLSIYRLPTPVLEVKRATEAKYDIWPIRFELDEKGRIWEVISKSIYVGRLDFLRELIQNGIDATLSWIYFHDESVVEGEIPRLWRLSGYRPCVLVWFDPAGTIEVVDNGVGMEKDSLQRFLFRVAETGFGERASNRGKRFPSIAKFGVGFVSCLVRAQSIVINTKHRTPQSDCTGWRVILKTQALDAYSEQAQCPEGTSIWLELKDQFSSDEIGTYLLENFVYPSVPIMFIDVTKIKKLFRIGDEMGVGIGTWRDFAKRFIEDRHYQSNMDIEDQINYVWGSVRDKLVGDEKRLKDTDSLDPEIARSNSIARRELNAAREQFNEIGTSHFFTIPPSPIAQSRLPTEPYWVYLDGKFTSRSISIGEKEDAAAKKFATVIVWIPVQVSAPEYGIEWASLHGFIVHAHCVMPSVVSYTGIADEFGNPDFAVAMSEEEWEDDEFRDVEAGVVPDLLDMMEHRRLRMRKEVEPKQEEVVRQIRVMGDSIVIAEDPEGEELADFFSLGSIVRHHELHDLVRWLDNGVYQDGIRIPVEGCSIAPIGACRSRCNLTGGARFELNVSRNGINETPTILRLWAQETGARIQTAVLDAVCKILNVNRCDYEPDVLLTFEQQERNTLLDHTARVFKQLTLQRR